MYIVINRDYEELGKFATLKEAKSFIKECKRFDKEQGNPFDEEYRIIDVGSIDVISIE